MKKEITLKMKELKQIFKKKYPIIYKEGKYTTSIILWNDEDWAIDITFANEKIPLCEAIIRYKKSKGKLDYYNNGSCLHCPFPQANK